MSNKTKTGGGKQAVVKEANRLCHNFLEDKPCFLQCKSFHLHRLGHELGLNEPVCRSDCEEVSNVCGAFGPALLSEAKLDVCHALQDSESCVSLLPAEPEEVKIKTGSQMCGDIFRNTKASGGVFIFKDLNLNDLPSNSRIQPICSNGRCRQVNETMSFSCLNTTGSAPYDPIPCKTAAQNGLFPLCPVRYTLDAGCKTIACCHEFNAQALAYYKNHTKQTYNARAFFMKFVNSQGGIISCSSITNGDFGNKCLQTFVTYASSDYSACGAYQKQFNSFGPKSSNDDLAFNLF